MEEEPIGPPNREEEEEAAAAEPMSKDMKGIEEVEERGG